MQATLRKTSTAVWTIFLLRLGAAVQARGPAYCCVRTRTLPQPDKAACSSRKTRHWFSVYTFETI